MTRLPILALLMTIFLPLQLRAAEEVRVLFLGNSYSFQVFYATLFEESPQGADFVGGLKAGVAEELQEAAAEEAKL